jgi:hypothetical protein
MSGDYVVAVEGLTSLRDIYDLAPNVLKSARQAINRTLDRARASSSREMRKQINFPARYLSGADGRLAIKRRASDRSLQGSILGRDRPTSLARFSNDRNPVATRKAGGVNVTVKPGATKFMPGAFLMNLRGGNTGLAVRLKDGQKFPFKKHTLTRVGKGLYLLYGPSVDQVFRTVSVDEAPKAADFLEAEFIRLMDL